MTHSHDDQDLKDLAAVASDLEGIAEVEPTVLKLDVEDALRLENLLLKKQLTEMSMASAKKQMEDEHKSYQDYLVAKLSIDIEEYNMQVNPADNTVLLTPK